MSSPLSSLLLVDHSPGLCAAAGLGHTPFPWPYASGWNCLCASGGEKACQSLGCLGVMKMMWLAPGIWAYLGWEGILGRSDITLTLAKPVANSVVGFLCD